MCKPDIPSPDVLGINQFPPAKVHIPCASFCRNFSKYECIPSSTSHWFILFSPDRQIVPLHYGAEMPVANHIKNHPQVIQRNWLTYLHVWTRVTVLLSGEKKSKLALFLDLTEKDTTQTCGRVHGRNCSSPNQCFDLFWEDHFCSQLELPANKLIFSHSSAFCMFVTIRSIEQKGGKGDKVHNGIS